MPGFDAATEADELPDNAMLLLTDDERKEAAQARKEAELQSILERWMVHQTFWTPIQALAMDDDRFVAGFQWPDELLEQRKQERRPALTFNMFPAFCRQITNAARQARPQIKVTPVETNRGPDARMKSVTGGKDYSVADVYSGLIRNIEHVSRADQAYDTALKHAVDHGFGWLYLMNGWDANDPFVQELRIHRVRNAYSVTMDPDSTEADFRDSQDAFMFSTMRRDTFQTKYPDADPDDFAGPTAGTVYEGWWDQDGVRVAQYFNIEYQDDEVLKLSNGKTVFLSAVKDVLDDLEYETGVHVINGPDKKPLRRKVKRPVCMWRKMTARQVLEGPLELPFSAIPIFPVLGEEILVDGQTQYESAIRHAKDAARSYNYWRTAATESVALEVRAPYLVTARQIDGHEEMFEQANTKNQPYLLYNHVDNVNPPIRIQAATPAAAELSNARQDSDDMQAIIGLHDASLGKESNEKSGRAIIARQNAGATSTFQFVDNLGRALEQMGRLIVEALPIIYDTQRIVRVRLPDGTEDFVEINQTVVDRASGQAHLVSDIGYGKYDVVLETGPSYATQRQEAADLQLELLKSLPPEMAQNVVHLIVKNLGVPGSDELYAVMRKMLPDALKSEEEKLADLPEGVTKNETGELVKDGEPWQPPQTPEMQLAAKQQQLDEIGQQVAQAKAEAEMATAEADKIQAEAKIAEAQAKLAAFQATQNAPDPEAQGQQMLPQMEAVIRQVMADHEASPQAHNEATSDMISAAVVDALQRVRGYVERKVATAQTPVAPVARSEAGAQAQVEPTRSGRDQDEEGPENEQRPTKVLFRYDGEGNLTEGVPVYDVEETRLANVRFVYDDDGDLVEAIPVYSDEETADADAD